MMSVLQITSVMMVVVRKNVMTTIPVQLDSSVLMDSVRQSEDLMVLVKEMIIAQKDLNVLMVSVVASVWMVILVLLDTSVLEAIVSLEPLKDLVLMAFVLQVMSASWASAVSLVTQMMDPVLHSLSVMIPQVDVGH